VDDKCEGDEIVGEGCILCGKDKGWCWRGGGGVFFVVEWIE
jgi:hypothetical protein